MTKISPFELERYFAIHEFTAPYLLSPSDCESLQLGEVLEQADPECLDLWNLMVLGYTESQGHPRLRHEITHLYSRVSPDDVLVMAPEEGIFIAMQTLLTAGDEVIVLLPAYQSLHEIARSLDCKVIPWQLVPDQSGWKLDLPALKKLITNQTRLLVINFPHNPTGFLPDLSELEQIVDLARSYNLQIFSDEMYRLLEHVPESRLPSVSDMYEQGVSLSGMSKSFALPGLRIGWLTTRIPGLIDRLLAYKDYTTICNSAPSEILALMALRARNSILGRNLKLIRSNLIMVEQFFQRNQATLHWLPPRAGSVCFPEWIGPGPVEGFIAEILEKKGVMIVPGRMFGDPGNHFRLGLGRRNLSEILALLEEILP